MSDSPSLADPNTSWTAGTAATSVMSAASVWPSLLQQLLDKQSLSRAQAVDLMEGWLAETIEPVLSGAILAALQAKGICPQELAGMAQVLQAQSLGTQGTDSDFPIRNFPFPVIDTCGTGGGWSFDF